MSSDDPTNAPRSQPRPPESLEDGQAARRKSALQPSPAEYRVEVSVPRSPWLDFHFRSPVEASPLAAVPAQQVPRHGAGKPEPEKVVVPVPMSLGRSAKQIWNLLSPGNDIMIAIAAVLLIGLAWCVVLCWYAIWAILVLPYRLITRPGAKTS
jgi:hypothetical protein